MEGVIAGASPVVRWGARVRLRLRIGLCLLARHEGGFRPIRLPSIRSQARSAGVHRNTVAAVYHDLERFGLVRCVQGKGTFATPPPDPRPKWHEPIRMAYDLADVLLTEVERELQARPLPDPGGRREPIGSGVLLLPLDVTPPVGHRVVPVAPRGAALAHLARLRPGSNVRLVSRSPSIARLMRHTLLALHGNTIGMRCIDGLPRSKSRVAAVRRARDDFAGGGGRTSRGVEWDLTLVDAYEEGVIVSDRGTPGQREAFIPLRVLRSGDERRG